MKLSGVKLLALYLIFLGFYFPARSENRKSLLIATYNVDNLFDTINDPGIHDLILTPEQYALKINNLSRAIGELKADILALCEIENSRVLDDLLRTPALNEIPYRYIHYDSPDPRGIDVALLYRHDRIDIMESEPLQAPDRYATRDVLRVKTQVEEQTFVFYVVHLPSRRGGRSRATRMRETLADSLNSWGLHEGEDSKVLILGDFNDNPGSKLISERLTAFRCTTSEPFKKGQGSYAWRDRWLMYDQILVTPNVRTTGEASVFVRPWLLTPAGRFKDYPDRTNFSDHLPVYLKVVF